MSDHVPHDDPTRVDLPPVDPTQAMPVATGGQPPPTRPPTGQPPAGPPDHGPWILAALLAAVVVTALGVVLLAGDGDDSASATTTSSSITSEVTTTTTEATTTTAPTTTTTEATTSTTPTPATVAPERCVSSAPDEPERTAQVVFEAFSLGDQDCVANLMTSTARDQLFAIPGAGGGWGFAGCFDEEEPDPHTICSFTFEGGSTGFRMSYSDTEGWTIYEVVQLAD